MHCNNILVPAQFSFRKGIPIEDAAVVLTDSVLKSVNQKIHLTFLFNFITDAEEFRVLDLKQKKQTPVRRKFRKQDVMPPR
jgi:hypothetical protein